ncbi:uncharacterized protein PgNI_06753 [Pyricularia grisea]|uniref:Uncharacterized protein n=1 Tax=Pyricularia grisea TaxID=148305 RepID=A0A6P8B2T1_PYRGI|nr:uncharacterized protein PgNI_06753 [Pyricularia grisea]TLD09220.1 hypothetical protein PgNI_06753 [Pyricularia grisea]
MLFSLLSRDTDNNRPAWRKRQPVKDPSLLKIFWLSMGVLGICGIAELFYKVYTYRKPPRPSWGHDAAAIQTTAPILYSCGNTPEEARALGCKFELHNFAWVPPECYDQQLGDDWDAQDWQFARTNLTPPAEAMIPKHVAINGELASAWVPWHQHMAHCALIWKKFHRAVALDRPMDSWTSSYAHSAHCADMLINWDLARQKDIFNSLLHLKFPTCSYEWKHQAENVTALIAAHSTSHIHHSNHGGES